MLKPNDMVSFLNQLAAQFMKSNMENIAENLMNCSIYILMKEEEKKHGKADN